MRPAMMVIAALSPTHGAGAVLPFVPLLAVLAWAAVVDGRTRRIPNALTIPLLLCGFVQSFLPCHTLAPGQAAMGFLVGAGPPLLLFLIRVRGAGDVKLQAAIGAWVGGPRVVLVFVLASLMAMVLALGQAWGRGRLRALLRDSALVAAEAACLGKVGLDEADNLVYSADPARARERYLPYAVPLLIATALTLAWGWLG